MNPVKEITQASVLEALSKVMDPELGKDLVTLNMIKDIRIDGAKITFRLVLTTPACPLRKELTENSKNAVLAVPGVKEVVVERTAEVPSARKLPDKEPIPKVKNTIAVASGKGGVGKSTVAVNLALALSKSGAKVGLLDTDIYGPSIPMMMGIHKQLQTTQDKKILPISNYGIKLMSVGFMLDEEMPLVWRGPMVMQIVKQFLTGVAWGDLDYLVIDLPPGTGDAQLTLVQTIPLTGAVVVTTPQDVALIDARRAIKMFHEVKVPLLGIIENMSYFQCPHCGEKTEIFSHGGGEKTSQRYNVPLLGKIPIDTGIREGGDSGKPIVIFNPSSPQTETFIKISEAVASKISMLDICE
ncbi:MAG TPA: iron-sulfur cluster carrier protein ApbC [Thermodesulfobacteriota bacterium]|nr:iron-sulfur cluster carrier protein ApbC [Thermodesulfobacteriota bacterium]